MLLSNPVQSIQNTILYQRLEYFVNGTMATLISILFLIIEQHLKLIKVI